MDNPVIKKQCHKCHQRKSLSDFYDKKKGRLGKDGICKKCRKAVSAASYTPRPRSKKYKKKYVGKRHRGVKNESQLNKVQRKIVARKLCHYRAIYKLLKNNNVDLNYFSTVEEKQIAHNDKIDKLLAKHNLGDIHYVKSVTL